MLLQNVTPILCYDMTVSNSINLSIHPTIDSTSYVEYKLHSFDLFISISAISLQFIQFSFDYVHKTHLFISNHLSLYRFATATHTIPWNNSFIQINKNHESYTKLIIYLVKYNVRDACQLFLATNSQKLNISIIFWGMCKKKF